MKHSSLLAPIRRHPTLTYKAQAVPQIGQALKLMIDAFESLSIIVTGPSAFDLHNQTGEPLTGRCFITICFPWLNWNWPLLRTAYKTVNNSRAGLSLVFTQR